MNVMYTHVLVYLQMQPNTEGSCQRRVLRGTCTETKLPVDNIIIPDGWLETPGEVTFVLRLFTEQCRPQSFTVGDAVNSDVSHEVLHVMCHDVSHEVPHDVCHDVSHEVPHGHVP